MKLQFNSQLEQPLTMEMSETPSGMAAPLCEPQLAGDTSGDSDTQERGPHGRRWQPAHAKGRGRDGTVPSHT